MYANTPLFQSSCVCLEFRKFELSELDIKRRLYFVFLLSVAFFFDMVSVGLAHAGEDISGGLLSGLLNPIFDWDDVVAMVVVGLWGAVIRRAAFWTLPIVSPLVMSVGAELGLVGVPVHFIDPGIALSGMIYGLLIVFLIKTPIPCRRPCARRSRN
mgnify:CR=1 FL=1